MFFGRGCLGVYISYACLVLPFWTESDQCPRATATMWLRGGLSRCAGNPGTTQLYHVAINRRRVFLRSLEWVIPGGATRPRGR